jgi:hypothetical protein
MIKQEVSGRIYFGSLGYEVFILDYLIRSYIKGTRISPSSLRLIGSHVSTVQLLWSCVESLPPI